MFTLKSDPVRNQLYVDSLHHMSFQQAFAHTRDQIMAHRFGDRAYATFLSGLSFWFHTGLRPAAIAAEDFLLLKPLAEHWIHTGELRPSVLHEFNLPEPELSHAV
ncbi:MAG: hypothetical protein ACTHN5_23565 [Phycisphaerae bacterium]